MEVEDEQKRVFVDSSLKSFSINKKKIITVADLICRSLKVNHLEIAIRFVGLQAIKNLNASFRHKNYSTDVLSFPQISWKCLPTFQKKGIFNHSSQFGQFSHGVLGDVVICPAVAERNANSIGQKLDREVLFLLVHGILHLCGYNHEKSSEEKKMLSLQKEIMKKIINSDTVVWQSFIKKKDKKLFAKKKDS